MRRSEGSLRKRWLIFFYGLACYAIALLTLFAIQHSVMARLTFKHYVPMLVPFPKRRRSLAVH